jgi:hypothetical protein
MPIPLSPDMRRALARYRRAVAALAGEPDRADGSRRAARPAHDPRRNTDRPRGLAQEDESRHGAAEGSRSDGTPEKC